MLNEDQKAFYCIKVLYGTVSKIYQLPGSTQTNNVQERIKPEPEGVNITCVL